MSKEIQTLNDYQDAALNTATYPGQGAPLGLMYVSLKGAGEAGEFAEKVGKLIRDDGFATTTDEIPPEKKIALAKEIGDELWYCASKARELGYTLQEIAVMNIDKLSDREARGVLSGSGDDR